VLTAIYTTRLVLLTFFGTPRNQHAYDHAHESPPVMAAPLVILATLAVVSGIVIFGFAGEGLGFAGGISEVVFTHEPHEFHFDTQFAVGATLSALFGVGIGLIYWWGRAERAERAQTWAPELHALLVSRYYIDDMYQAFINRVVLGAAAVIAVFDKKVVNESGVDGGAQGINWLGFRLKFLQTGKIPNYALGMAVGVVALALVAFRTS
jgi:NADH-quinone oxidoreductase subunit L